MIKSYLKCIFLLCIISLSAACVDRGLINLQSGNLLANSHWQAEEPYLKVPFYWHDGHIIVDVAFNGKAHLKFAFDSAAAATVLFETPRTKSIILNKSTSIEIQNSLVDVVNDAQVILGSVELSELTIVHVPLAQNPLFADAEQAYFDGVIGYDLLNRYKVQINFAEQVLVLYKDEISDFTAAKWDKVPLEVLGRIPYIAANIVTNKYPVTHKFVVDTGAPDYLYINSSLAEGVEFPSQLYQTNTKNFDGDHILKTAKINGFDFAGHHFLNLTTHDMPYFEDEVGVGLIGSRLLRNFDVIFDYQNAFMAIKRNSQFTTKSMLDRSGIHIEPHKLGAIVLDVATDSHAYQIGIKVGDIITKIDNQMLSIKHFDVLRDKLSSLNEQLHICWQSKAVARCEEVNLADRN